MIFRGLLAVELVLAEVVKSPLVALCSPGLVDGLGTALASLLTDDDVTSPSLLRTCRDELVAASEGMARLVQLVEQTVELPVQVSCRVPSAGGSRRRRVSVSVSVRRASKRRK